MKAVLLTGAGGIDKLEMSDVPDPVLESPDDILVRLHAAGINPVDYKLRRGGGFYPDRLPLILGCDGAGVVEEVGGDVFRFKAGDEVYFCNGGMGGDEQGNYAQLTAIHQDYVAFKPKNLSMVEAAAVPLVLLTAWESLYDRGRLESGQSVLIHGGAGGVGYIAVQLAKKTGATVFTTISDEAKADFARSLGADHCINYKEEDFDDEVMRLTGNDGVDFVFDTVGKETFPASFAAAKIYGRVVTLSEDLCGQEAINLAKLRNLSISYELMLTPQHYKLHEARVRQTKMLTNAAKMIESGDLKVVVNNIFSFKEIGRAHQAIESGHSTGKNVIKIL
jgi:NADPH:quinone reductase